MLRGRSEARKRGRLPPIHSSESILTTTSACGTMIRYRFEPESVACRAFKFVEKALASDAQLGVDPQHNLDLLCRMGVQTRMNQGL